MTDVKRVKNDNKTLRDLIAIQNHQKGIQNKMTQKLEKIALRKAEGERNNASFF